MPLCSILYSGHGSPRISRWECAKNCILLNTLTSVPPKTSDDWKASHGEAVVGMIINRPGLTDQFHHMFSQFFADKPLNKLIREGIESEQLNDKVIERTLDELFEADVSKAYFELAIKAPGFISPSTKPIREENTDKAYTKKVSKRE